MAHTEQPYHDTPHSDEKWIAIIEEWRKSGMSISEWCRNQEEITYHQFMHYRKRLFPEDLRPNEFMNQETSWSSLTMEIPTSSLDVVINDCRIVVPSGFDQALLREVVEVLKEDA
jgi:hypothetical protein